MSKNGSKVGCWITVVILLLLLGGCFLAGSGLLISLGAKASNLKVKNYPVDEAPEFEEIWSYGYGDTKVVRIELQGVISRGRRERLIGFEPDMVENILTQILAATRDDEVKAIMLEVDSPGGGVTPSDEIYAALLRFKAQDPQRRILVFIRDVGASGAYYAAMAGDCVVVQPTAIVGSIGVIMQTINIKGLSDKLGLSSVTIASGENKDMLNPFEEVDPKHVAVLQEMIDEMQDRFASIVQNARGLESRELLDGRIFSASQALEHRLIDRIGYWEDAVEQLETMLDVDELYFVRYQVTRSFFDELMGVHMPKLPELDSLDLSPRFLYQWKP